MSKIDKLQIVGVRSFNHAIGEVVQFYSPLTLIVGLNGSGKTTIIESLLYATTGELPPNSTKSGAWIRDPKLCGENEVLAQVKLSFNSTSGAKMIVNRSIQVTVKKTAKTQKTLECTLMMRNAGERTVVSSRVAELDQIMPQYLGVSKAILESVIFCHQDDSLWPMSTPLILKKKFDEIFEALKYSKAVDNIKLIRKTQVAELEKHKMIEQHAKEDKNKGAKAEKKSQLLTAEIDELRDSERALRVKMDDALEKARNAFDHCAKFEKIIAELNGKRIEAHATEKSIQSLRQRMKVMSDSDEALRDMQDKYDERLALHKREIEVQRKRYQELVEELDIHRDALGSKQAEVGRYQAQKDQYDRQIANRQELIKETARRHDVRGFNSDVTDDHVRDFMERIGKMAREQNSAFERARKETQEESQKTQQLLNSLNERRSALGQTKTGAAGLIRTNDLKIARFQTELDKIDIDEGAKIILETTLQDLERRLSKDKEDYETAKWDNQIQSTDSKAKALEEQKDVLDRELMEASRHANDSARLDYLRKELKDREQSLTTMSGAHGDRLTTLLGSDWEPSSLEQRFQNLLAEKTSAVRDSEVQRQGLSRELEQLDFKISTSSSELKQKRKEMIENESAVQKAVNDSPSQYLIKLQELEYEIDELKFDNSGNQAKKDYYEKCLESAKEYSLCQTCRRPFKKDSDALTAFITRLETVVKKAQESVFTTELNESESAYKQAKKAQPRYDAFIRLRDEMPKLEEMCKTLDSRRDDLSGRLEHQDQLVKDCEDEKRDVESMAKTIQNMHRYYTEIGNFQSQIHELEGLQNAAGLSRSLDKIQEEQKKMAEQIRAVNSQLQKLRLEKDRSRSLINKLELEVRDAKARHTAAMHQLKEKTNLQSQIEDAKAQSAEQRETMKCAEQDIQSLVPQIAQTQTTLEDVRQRGDERTRALQKMASNLTDSLRQLSMADQEINAYLDRGGAQQLDRAAKEISHHQEKIDGVESEQRLIAVDIKKNEEALRGHEETKRAITDNLAYREDMKRFEKLHKAIETLSAHNAETDKERFEREGNKWQHERNILSAEQATTIGTLKSKDDQLQQLISEFEIDYKDAAEKFRHAEIRVQITKAAIEDLGRYAGALDMAIMKYHGLKMEEINRIIDELWRSTYQGTDVDTIMIRSENENQKGNKSYNYRVVMVKQDAEMDMRGRCSAGQKVLASIIIRLALAECFGIRCGLIALDEPTTNLDRDNIRALAESLSNIIRIRKQQSNFQLIVITHDEDFLRYMNCADFTDYYYKVDRGDNQCSRIRQQRIQDVV